MLIPGPHPSYRCSASGPGGAGRHLQESTLACDDGQYGLGPYMARPLEKIATALG